MVYLAMADIAGLTCPLMTLRQLDGIGGVPKVKCLPVIILFYFQRIYNSIILNWWMMHVQIIIVNSFKVFWSYTIFMVAWDLDCHPIGSCRLKVTALLELICYSFNHMLALDFVHNLCLFSAWSFQTWPVKQFLCLIYADQWN